MPRPLTTGSICPSGECASEFRSLDDRLDQVERHFLSMGERIAIMGERSARLEASTEGMRADVRQMAQRLETMPGELLAAVRAHSQDCVGRALAMDRITTGKRTPQGGSYPPSMVPAPDSKDLPVPRWLMWIGGAIGAAVVGAGYGLAKVLGVMAAGQ